MRSDVVRRPRVGVISTGDELVDGSEPLALGQVRDSNRYSLLSLVREAGLEGVDLGLVRDDPEVIRATIARGAETCDAVLTSGGVSMGDYDCVKVVLDEMGEMSWMQVAIKPAKPFAFGLVGGTPVFGLPGNTVSSMVSFELLARPALRRMMGHAQLHRPRVQATAAVPAAPPSRRQDPLRPGGVDVPPRSLRGVLGGRAGLAPALVAGGGQRLGRAARRARSRHRRCRRTHPPARGAPRGLSSGTGRAGGTTPPALLTPGAMGTAAGGAGSLR